MSCGSFCCKFGENWDKDPPRRSCPAGPCPSSRRTCSSPCRRWRPCHGWPGGSSRVEPTIRRPALQGARANALPGPVRCSTRRRLREGPREQRVDRRLAVGPEKARARAAEAGLPDQGGILGAPSLAGPAEPSIALLVEDVERLVQDLRVLASHARAPGHGVVRVDLPHDEDLLGVVHLVPDRLQHLAEERRVGKLPVPGLSRVPHARVAAPQLGARQDAPTTLAHGVVPLEGEVDLVDAVSLRGGAEGRLRDRRAAAEENAVLAPHARSFPGTFSPIARTWSNGCATR